MERLCCWGSHTGRSLEIAHNCQVLVATVAAVVVHSWNMGSYRLQWWSEVRTVVLPTSEAVATRGIGAAGSLRADSDR